MGSMLDADRVVATHAKHHLIAPAQNLQWEIGNVTTVSILVPASSQQDIKGNARNQPNAAADKILGQTVRSAESLTFGSWCSFRLG